MRVRLAAHASVRGPDQDLRLVRQRVGLHLQARGPSWNRRAAALNPVPAGPESGRHRSRASARPTASGEDDLAAGREVVELAYRDDVLDLVDEVVLGQSEQVD